MIPMTMTDASKLNTEVTMTASRCSVLSLISSCSTKSEKEELPVELLVTLLDPLVALLVGSPAPELPEIITSPDWNEIVKEVSCSPFWLSPLPIAAPLVSRLLSD